MTSTPRAPMIAAPHQGIVAADGTVSCWTSQPASQPAVIQMARKTVTTRRLRSWLRRIWWSTTCPLGLPDLRDSLQRPDPVVDRRIGVEQPVPPGVVVLERVVDEHGGGGVGEVLQRLVVGGDLL